MGFGCNAAAVAGCRIIDSPRERLIAIITNSFVPCNGKFPTLFAIISIFLVCFASPAYRSILSAVILTAAIVLAVFLTLLTSKLLSVTLLKGVPSSIAFELPPYRRPQISKIIVRSVFDRTLFVLCRAISVAAPAGLIIWLLSNLSFGGISLFMHCVEFLNPFAKAIGLDGYILVAFVLSFPANELLIPVLIMGYMSGGSITGEISIDSLGGLLYANGWTPLTAICVMLFSLMHWPCATTCLTIKKETQSLKWTLASMIIPTLLGITFCFALTSIVRIIGALLH